VTVPLTLTNYEARFVVIGTLPTGARRSIHSTRSE
jgi:hypothetical protein